MILITKTSDQTRQRVCVCVVTHLFWTNSNICGIFQYTILVLGKLPGAITRRWNDLFHRKIHPINLILRACLLSSVSFVRCHFSAIAI